MTHEFSPEQFNINIEMAKPPIKNPKDGISKKGSDTIRGTGGKQPPIIKKG